MSNQLLSNALKELHQLQKKGSIFKSSDFTGKNMSYLKKAGYIKPVIRGWYYQSHPADSEGDTTAWYSGYWEFVAKYLDERFGDDYCLNPEISLLIHTRYSIIPKQIVVVTRKSSTAKVALPCNNSLFIYPDNKRFPDAIVRINDLTIYTLEEALCKVSPGFFRDHQEEIEIALGMIKEISVLLNILLTRERMDDAAGRICGALKFAGREEEASRLKRIYETATFKHVSTANPFKRHAPFLTASRERNPYALRLQSIWRKYSAEIRSMDIEWKRSEASVNIKSLIEEMEEKYRADAYHSLSIEGYKVSLELIEKVSHGEWDPTQNSEDRNMKNALAAKGYYEAFEAVKQTIIDTVQDGKEITRKLADDHHIWYTKLFAPSVQAGIIEAKHLAGYRTHQVYLRGSQHVPFPPTAIVDAMETYFELLEGERDPVVRALLGHFMFGFIHPYMDGNGRMARFIMNAILVSNGYPWVIIRVEERKTYMEALERASVMGDIRTFAQFIAGIEQVGK